MDRLRASLFAIMMVGCSSSSTNPMTDAADVGGDAPDAGMAGPCWPVESTTPGGVIQLGGGEGGFVPMPDELPVVYGSQNGFHIPVHARITSMVPGNPSDFLDPANPRTRFRAFFADTGLPINPGMCPVRIAYKPANATDFDLVIGSAVLFDVGLPEAEIFGRQIRVVVEIIDSNKKYATQEKLITCRKPIGWP